MECMTQARHSSVGAMADNVVFVLRADCRFSTFFCAHQEKSNELFLGAASAISRPEIISIAGKNFLFQNKSENYILC